MINDRGRKKWAPFLIPEHKKRIAQIYVAQDDVNRPELDEQLHDTLQERIASAIENQLEVVISYHQNKRSWTAVGTIKKADPYARTISIDSGCGDLTIPFQFITNIEIDR